MTLELIHAPLLRERTTLRLGGPALAEAVARAQDDLDRLGETLAQLGGRALPIGAGSNLLPAGGEAGLVLLRAQNAADPEIARRDAETVVVRAAAGLPLPRLLAFAAALGLSGLEGLAGIPGRVGGALAMNAGSFGTQICANLARVRLWTPRSGLLWRAAADCRYGYRSFDPRPDAAPWLAWEAEFALAPDAPDAVRGRMAAVYAKKKASQPVTEHSAGCVFKNPPAETGLPAAGRLLDAAGMRGRSLGGMAFSERHANFLVNRGGGTADQALELLETGREAVRRKSGVELETEVVVLR